MTEGEEIHDPEKAVAPGGEPSALSDPPGGAARSWVAQAALALAVLAAYSNSFRGEFIFDDRQSILENQTIKSLWPPWAPLFPPDGMTVTGRPVVNLTLALNYAVGGFNVWGYHAFNLAVHLLAALALFQAIRLTLRRLPDARWAGAADGIALAAAALWALHPLQTESVTYVIQRAESLAGLLYLAALLAFIRALGSPRAAAWLSLSAAACAVGMATKEVMATAPLLIFLYDRVFVARSFMEIVERRWKYYAALAATWGIAGTLGLTASGGWISGLGLEGLPPSRYLMNQTMIVPYYIRLAGWPRPLVIDYGWSAADSWGEVWYGAALTLALLAASVVALAFRPRIGFLAAAFFLLLAPSSSVLPFADLAAERRMYLPLACLALLAALGAASLFRALLGARAPVAAWAAGAAVCAALGAGTHARNRDYKDEVAIFSDAIAKRPSSARAHNSLGSALQRSGRLAEAEAMFKQAVELDHYDVTARYNLGAVIALQGRKLDAIGPFSVVLMQKPDHPQAHNNVGALLAERLIFDEALDHFEKAITALPNYDEAWNNKGSVLCRLGRNKEAIEAFNRALELRPGYAEAHNGMAVALAGMGRAQDALDEAEKALALKPEMIDAVNNAAAALAMLGRLDDAIAKLRRAAELAPQNSAARLNLGMGLAQKGDLAGAAKELAEAVRLDPRRPDARNRYGTLLAIQGNLPGAIEQFEKALEAEPYNEEAKANLKKAKGMGGGGAPGSILDSTPRTP